MPQGSTGEDGKSSIISSYKSALMCAVKSASPLQVQVLPGSWFVPPGSNRSGGGGNKAVGASGVEGRYGDLASV